MLKASFVLVAREAPFFFLWSDKHRQARKNSSHCWKRALEAPILSASERHARETKQKKKDTGKIAPEETYRNSLNRREVGLLVPDEGREPSLEWSPPENSW